MTLLIRMYLHFCNWTRQIGTDHVCIDISLTTANFTSSWKLGSCSFSPYNRKLEFGKQNQKIRQQNESTQNDITVEYVEICCIAPGIHTLTCEDTGKLGWRGGYVKIQGHIYCHDFVGYRSRQKLLVSGNHISLELLIW